MKSTLITFDDSTSCHWFLQKTVQSLNGMRVVGKGSWKEREVGKTEVDKFR